MKSRTLIARDLFKERDDRVKAIREFVIRHAQVIERISDHVELLGYANAMGDEAAKSLEGYFSTREVFHLIMHFTRKFADTTTDGIIKYVDEPKLMVITDPREQGTRSTEDF